MSFEILLLLILTILPILYKYWFWLYVIQLKEYRLDRFKEYLSTRQWKSSIINIWSILELLLLIFWLIIFYNKPFEIINYNILFYFLLIYNLFVIGKIIRKKLIKPKFTTRILLIIILFLVWWSIDSYYLLMGWYQNWIYFYLPFVLLFSPVILFFYIFLTLPLVNYKKNKLINKAIKKSNKINDAIKIWITWSYWKSSIKEFLSSILEQDWKTLKSPENINTELWISDLIITRLKKWYKYFIAEMWAYKIWEIELLWNIVNHKYWFLTAIWNQHIALFWSQQNIQKGKSEIEKKIIKNKWSLYVNWNDKYIKKTKFSKKTNLIKYWKTKWADAIYKILSIKKWITEFNFKYKKINVDFKTELLWEHNVLNLTGVLAFCYDMWIKTADLKKYLKNIKSPKNTLNLIKTKKYNIIDDSYNLSEDWLYAWLNALNSFNWNKVLVMDDVLELWIKAESIHYTIGEYIARKWDINQVIFCWTNHKKEFTKWLLENWFSKKNILDHHDKIKKWSNILLEWRKTNKFLDILK